MRLLIDLDKVENDNFLTGILSACRAFIRNRDSARTAITAASIKAKIKEMETHPSFENAGLADVLRAQLPKIEAAEQKSFTPEQYRAELLSRWPSQYQYLERNFINPADPMAPEKLEILDAIEQEGDQCNQRPDLFMFDSPNMARRNPDEILWQNAMSNRREASNAYLE